MLPNKNNSEEYGQIIFLGFQVTAGMLIIMDLHCEIYQMTGTPHKKKKKKWIQNEQL